MYNVTMNFHVEVCIQYEGCNSRTLMTSGALLLFSLSYVYGQKYSTQREGTFANCLRFTKLYVERPISTLCMRDIPFPETCGHAGRKRTNISPKLLFAVCRPIFNSKRRNELFSVPFQRIYPPSRAEFRDAGSSLGSLDLTSTTISRATTLTASGMVLLLRITSNSAWRDACVCMYLAHVICTRVCVCVYIRASAIRSLVPVQRSKPTNPLPARRCSNTFFSTSSLVFPFRRSSLRFAFALAGDRFEIFDSRIILKSIHPLDQSRSGNSKISLLSLLSFFIGKSQE